MAFLKTHPFSIICHTETWISLDDSDIFSLCSIDNYNLFLHPRTSGRGCGVDISVHMDLQSPSISPIALYYGECISCNFRLKFKSLHIIVIYHPPKDDFSIFVDELHDLINYTLHLNAYKVMIVGDFNYHFYSSSPAQSSFKLIPWFLTNTYLFLAIYFHSP